MHRTRKAPPRYRPRFEQLEDRTTPSTFSLTEPLQIQSITPLSNNQLQLNGILNLPGGIQQAFSAPLSITSQQNIRSCTILNLQLQGLDLNILGLAVHLDPVNLQILAQRGRGQLLGNLLCGGSPQSRRGTAFLRRLSPGLTDVFTVSEQASRLVAPAGPLGTGLPFDVSALSSQLTASGVTAGTTACPILDLRIDKLDLNLLGLEVRSLTPIHLTVTAIPGPGNLLGNLLCQISHALDATGSSPHGTGSTLSTLLSGLTGSLLGGAGQAATPTATSGLPRANLAGGTATPSRGTCNILSLDVGPVHLNLLGLVVDLSEIRLKITAESGPGNLLGNLLCQNAATGNLRAILANLRGLLGVLGAGTSTTGGLGGTTPATGPFGNGATLARLVNEVAGSSSPNATATCPILNLTIPPINLNLLGLRIQTLAPITLNITATPGAGELLGNLLCDLVNLLNSPPV